MSKHIIDWSNSESEISFRKKIKLNFVRIWKFIFKISNKVKKLETLKLKKDTDLNAIVGEEE